MKISFAVTLGVTLCFPICTRAMPNLLTRNSDFETGDGGGYNGAGAVPGWNYRNQGFKYFGVGKNGKDDSKAFSLTEGGWIETAPDARVTVTAGTVYRLSFDARKTRDNYPEQFIGVRSELRFYDAEGKFLQFYRPVESLNGPPTNWETITFLCTAPANSVTAGVFVKNWQGQFFDAKRNFTMARDVLVDNFRLEGVPESEDSVRLRRAPRLVEPGKKVLVCLATRTTKSRIVSLRLRNGKSLFPAVSHAVAAARETIQLEYLVPASATRGDDYSWEAVLLDARGQKIEGIKPSISTDVILDETVSTPVVAADDKQLVFQGRWAAPDAKSRLATWAGSAVHVRFKGTSLRLRADVRDYQGPKDRLQLAVFIDGDEANFAKSGIGLGNNQLVTLAENLAPGVHYALVVRISEVTRGPLVVRGFETDADGGFLRAEPASSRRIEFYGDSITEGGTTVANVADPNPKAGDRDYGNNQYFTYANIAARSLDADGRFIAKGGMALSGNAFVPFLLPEIFDKVDFSGDVKAASTVDFAAWQPDAIVVGIGHNDPFSKGYGEEKFAAKYQEFLAELRRRYPNAHIFCTDTTMTMDNMRQWEKAVIPIMKNDPKVHLNLFAQIDTGGHPHGPEHRMMAVGGGKQLNNLVDWIGETLNW